MKTENMFSRLWPILEECVCVRPHVTCTETKKNV